MSSYQFERQNHITFNILLTKIWKKFYIFKLEDAIKLGLIWFEGNFWNIILSTFWDARVSPSRYQVEFALERNDTTILVKQILKLQGYCLI